MARRRILIEVQCKTLQQFRKRSKIGTFPENVQETPIEGGVTLISIFDIDVLAGNGNLSFRINRNSKTATMILIFSSQ